MNEVIFPVIVVTDDSQVEYYDSIQTAATLMEPADVEDGLYKAYDSEGKLLHIIVKHKKHETPFLFKPIFFILDILSFSLNHQDKFVEIFLSPDYQDKRDELVKNLSKYLTYKGLDTEHKNLPELIKMLCEQ